MFIRFRTEANCKQVHGADAETKLSDLIINIATRYSTWCEILLSCFGLMNYFYAMRNRHRQAYVRHQIRPHAKLAWCLSEEADNSGLSAKHPELPALSSVLGAETRQILGA